jgi:hypothetical protein
MQECVTNQVIKKLKRLTLNKNLTQYAKHLNKTRLVAFSSLHKAICDKHLESPTLNTVNIH